MLMAPISAVNGPRSISTPCSTTSDANVLGLLGILAGLGLLIWLSYRGWSILLLRRPPRSSPPPRRRAAACALDPDLHGRGAGFLAQFFPLFLLGALFGKLMEDSGSVEVIAAS